MKVDPMMSRFCNRPLFLDRSYARQLFSSVSEAMNIVSLEDENGDVSLDDKVRAKSLYPYGSSSEERYRPYRLEDGVAVIRVHGSLMHGSEAVSMWYAGYQGIVRVVSLAMDDPEVDGVLLVLDSPGGEVAGCFDTAQYLRELGKIKPLGAVAHDMNLSAAMCLASAAEVRFITQTGEAGSIGVVMAHFSYEEMDKKNGLEVTLIHSGEHKVDGNDYQNLPDEVFKSFQTECHELRQQFATIVSEHTDMSLDDVLATEAAVYRGQAAIDVGLADELVNGHEVVDAFRNYLSSQDSTTTTGATMETNGTKPGDRSGTPTDQPAGAESQAAIDAAAAQSTQEATARIQGILSHENAKGREALANHLAFKTSLSLEDAAAALAAQPIEEDGANEPSPGQALENAMGNEPGAEVPAGGAGDEPGAAERMAETFAQVTGRKRKSAA